MVNNSGRVAASEQRGEFGFELLGGFEFAVGTDVLGERAVQRAGDVAGDRVDRFHLTPKTRCATGVDDSLAGFTYVFCYSVYSCQGN